MVFSLLVSLPVDQQDQKQGVGAGEQAYQAADLYNDLDQPMQGD